MSVTMRYNDNDATCMIKINGDFDRTLLNEFYKMAKEIKRSPVTVILDLHDTFYIDSSALEILMAIKDCTAVKVSDIFIENMDDIVFDMFQVLNFHLLFTAERRVDQDTFVWRFQAK